jgi:mono/diheme cytochrome c family protein
VKNSHGVYGVTYRWGDSLTNAMLVPDGGQEETFTVYDGATPRTQVWRYPSRGECLVCHTRAAGWGLGFNTVQLNRDSVDGGAITNQIAAMSQAGLFTSPVTNLHSLRALASASDESASVEWRVRSYLAANCAQCHQPGATAPGFFSASVERSTADSGLINGALNDFFGSTNNRVVVPGSLANSMLLTRISTRGPGQMPPLASSVLDTQAIALLSRWITNGLAGHQTFDQWQIASFGSTNAPEALASADPDEDGANNYEEYVNGTDPNQRGDAWGIGLQRNGAAVQITYPQLPNRAVQIESSANVTDPASWRLLNVQENRPLYPAASGTAVIPDMTTNGPGKFYRARVLVP